MRHTTADRREWVPVYESLVPMLRVEDASDSVKFYGELGFKVVHSLEEDGRLVWAHLECGKAAVMVSEQPGEVETAPGHGPILYLRPVDAPALRARLEEKRRLPGPLRKTDYGMTEFKVLDPDGYELWIGSPAPDTA